MKRYIPPRIRAQIRLRNLLDDRTPEQRKRAIIAYDVAFALWQEWHADAVRVHNIRKLRAAVHVSFRGGVAA